MGGSMHIFKEHRFYGGHGVGGQIPVGAGLALQINILKQTQ
jgi:TPP-dependent pyruvate/acetoin dehydrogenase alpha subunit